MTSATATNKSGSSRAARALNIALGKQRVYLRDFHKHELEELLKTNITNPDLRYLRGFKELREALSHKSEEGSVVVSKSASLVTTAFPEETPFTLKSQVVQVAGILEQKRVFRLHESDEETSDENKARTWGHAGYLHRGEESILFLRRLPDDGYNEDIFVEVGYLYAKVPTQKEYVVKEISAKLIPLSQFCRHFGKKSPDIARKVIWEMRRIYSRTLDDLEGELNLMRHKLAEWERLAGSVG